MVSTRVIEWSLPLEEISLAATREKSVRHGHPCTLALWWARRPLASSRTTTFASLIDLPDSPKERMELTKIIRDLAPWSTVKDGNGPIISTVRKILKEKWPLPPKILDPFAGGGSIPLEALRLGCETYANDLNPVAVLIQKATLEWPHIHPEFVLDRVKFWAQRIKEEAQEEIGCFYPSETDGWIAGGYIWARTIPCSNLTCSAEIPLIKHFWLAKREHKKVAYKPIIDPETNNITFKIQENKEIDFDPVNGTVTRGNARCLICGQITQAALTRKLSSEGKMGYRLIAIIRRNPNVHGKTYRLATQQDLKIWEKASRYLQKKLRNWPWLETPLPDEELPPAGSLGVNLQAYGIKQWKDLFNDRQKLSLVTFLDLIKKFRKDIENECAPYIKKEELVKAISGYLTLILGRMADKNATLVVYNVYGEKIEHVFGRTALPIKWDYAEVNVFSGGNGDWAAHTKWVTRFIEANLWKVENPITITQKSATSLPYSDSYFDAVITDPPYYDNIPYSDLADFFYVWFKRAVGDLFPDLFATPLTPKTKEIVANKRRHADPKDYFETELARAFTEMYRVLKPDGICVIVYAHKSLDGWEAFMNALAQSGFVVTAAMPIQTEMKARLRAKTSAALASSVHIVCRKKSKIQPVPFETVKEEITNRIHNILDDRRHRGGSGGDSFNVAIGPALEIWSQYEALILPSGMSLTAKDLLKNIHETFGFLP